MVPQSQAIGPYTLEKRLGTGGMGEVYQAYDQRLDRWVAIKLIRPEHMEKSTARERFRREARAAARLSHPSIVQIYDIVESDESDAIVLELVEGEPLSRRIDRGPLPVEEAVRFGRQIAEGLAAAHARGLIHRDLKPENVMVTPEGRAKILDFGLAKRLEGEASLTEDHKVIGTFRSMSPEQAQGLSLDHRSDLFSLGILLYEMLSGRSPFEGGSTLETLTRICTHRQSSLREIDPSIPDRLSGLVDLLLEKEPALRPPSAQNIVLELERLGSAPWDDVSDDKKTLIELPRVSPEPSPKPMGRAVRHRVAGLRWGRAAGAVLILVGAGLWRFMPERPEPLYVAVPAPTVVKGAGVPGVEVLSIGLRSSVLDGLASLDNILPLAPEQVDPIIGAPREIARATAADEVVSTRMSCDVVNCQILLSGIRGQDGALLWSRTFTAPIEQPYLLAEAVMGHVRAVFPDRPGRDGSRKLEVRPADYAEYLRLLQSFDTKREEEWRIQEILAKLAAIRRSSPHFLAAFMLESYVLQHKFRYGRDATDLNRAFQALEEARRLAPRDPRPLLSTFEAAMLGQRLDLAEESLEALERLQPGDVRGLADRARLLERRGDSQKALQLIKAAAERLPSWRHLFWAADMEYRHGRIAEARAHLSELLLRFPGNYDGMSLLAQLELFNGSPRRAAELYTALTRRSPQFAELANLGLSQFLLGSFEESEQSYRRALELQPLNALAALNLADVCLLRGRKEEAHALYGRTLSLATRDPSAGADWQLSSVRAQALAHLGRNDEAVAAVQEVLRLAPTNPQAAYEASLVFVLLGDRASALFNARRAVQHGMEPRWYSFPWFAPLRSSPEFRRLLQTGR